MAMGKYDFIKKGATVYWHDPDGGLSDGEYEIISAPEEIAFRAGWITKERLLESAARYGKSPYGRHLTNVAAGKIM